MHMLDIALCNVADVLLLSGLDGGRTGVAKACSRAPGVAPSPAKDCPRAECIPAVVLEIACLSILPMQRTCFHLLDAAKGAVLRPSLRQLSTSASIYQHPGSHEEDAQDRIMIPWVRTVINGVAIMRHPKFNKVRCLG